MIVAENETTFETLPPVKSGLAVFGRGNAAELLVTTDWLKNCKIYYWGDIDEHGFAILSRLRNAFPHTKSVMMDLGAYCRFQNFSVAGEKAGCTLENLTQDEREAYELVKNTNKRLEQERIPQVFALQVIKQVVNSGKAPDSRIDCNCRFPS